jgi:hypothetical protein
MRPIWWLLERFHLSEHLNQAIICSAISLRRSTRNWIHLQQASKTLHGIIPWRSRGSHLLHILLMGHHFLRFEVHEVFIQLSSRNLVASNDAPCLVEILWHVKIGHEISFELLNLFLVDLSQIFVFLKLHNCK